ncbi:MAG: hypothetical protein CMJ32_06955 [Phycisphaerae bacterium]|nr:hypothetical protein [Phycisphaerae bacterium]
MRHLAFKSRILLAVMIAMMATPSAMSWQDVSAASPSMAPLNQQALAAANEAYKQTLKVLVTPEGMIRFDAFTRMSSLQETLESIVDTYARAPEQVTPETRIALLCNAHNANMLLLVARAMTDETFQPANDLPGLMSQQQVMVSGRRSTMEKLVKEQLASLGDPRIHAAISKGTSGSPRLHGQPLDPSKLDQQLDSLSRKWVNNAELFIVQQDTLIVPNIIRDSIDDFSRNNGEGIIAFVKKYAEDGTPISSIRTISNPVQVTFDVPRWQLLNEPIRRLQGRQGASRNNVGGRGK